MTPKFALLLNNNNSNNLFLTSGYTLAALDDKSGVSILTNNNNQGIILTGKNVVDLENQIKKIFNEQTISLGHYSKDITPSDLHTVIVYYQQDETNPASPIPYLALINLSIINLNEINVSGIFTKEQIQAIENHLDQFEFES